MKKAIMLFTTVIVMVVVVWIDLVKDMRVKRAIQLLDSGNYNISQVAYMSGFSSPQYFSRVFKELKNCTPSEYKTKAFD